MTAVSIGYMVGASNSPVVGSITPAVFGIVIFALGVLKIQKTTGSEHAQVPGSPSMDVSVIPLRSVRQLGIMLTLFSISYFGAALLGTEIRALAVAKKSPELPWAANSEPNNLDTALQWLVIQKRLEAYGYTPGQVRQVYGYYQKSSASTQQQQFLNLSNKLIDSVPEPGQLLKKPDICSLGCFAGDPDKTSHVADKTASHANNAASYIVH